MRVSESSMVVGRGGWQAAGFGVCLLHLYFLHVHLGVAAWGEGPRNVGGGTPSACRGAMSGAHPRPHQEISSVALTVGT